MDPTRVLLGVFLMFVALAVPALTPGPLVGILTIFPYVLTLVIVGGGILLAVLGLVSAEPGTMRTDAVRVAYDVAEPGSLDLAGMTLVFRAGRRLKLRLPVRAVKEISTRRRGDLMEVQLHTGRAIYSLMLHSASPLLQRMLELIANAESSQKPAGRIEKGSEQPLIQP